MLTNRTGRDPAAGESSNRELSAFQVILSIQSSAREKLAQTMPIVASKTRPFKQCMGMRDVAFVGNLKGRNKINL